MTKNHAGFLYAECSHVCGRSIDHRQHVDRSAIMGHRTHEVIALDVFAPLWSQVACGCDGQRHASRRRGIQVCYAPFAPSEQG
jgi:hypothetical protein